ncbi:MAG: Mbeg1-like protein [Bacilli bacterium]
MSSLFDYLTWRGDLSFSQSRFNAVDNLILSELVYFELDEVLPKYPSLSGVAFSEAINSFFEKHPISNVDCGLFLGKDPAKLAEQMAKTKRFGNIQLFAFVNEVDMEAQEQFSVLSFRLKKNLIYVAFKGTDDSLIGWQEDLNMVVQFPIKAQVKASEYLKKVMDSFPEAKFIVGGHSKGGNLAYYSACSLEESYQNCLLKVYSNDGPGFLKENLLGLNKPAVLKKSIQIVPYDCIVGNLFENPIPKRIVVKTSTKGILEHSGFFWRVEGNSFQTEEKVSQKSCNVRKEINKLLEGLSEEDRFVLVKGLYQLLISTKKNTLLQLKQEGIFALKAFGNVNAQMRKVMFAMLGIFIRNQAL